MNDQTRRAFLYGSTAAGAALLAEACRSRPVVSPEPVPRASSSTGTDEHSKPKDDKGEDEPEVTATEDMIREHGVLRRALIVYREAAMRLRGNAAAVSPGALTATAKLFRSFGEEYHEKKLEEAYVFPAVQKGGGAAAALTDVLQAQHERGLQITDYIIAVTTAPKLGARAAELATVLESFARMYEAHTAREDTVLFPAWKKAVSPKQLEELGEKFEDIEHAQFGEDGFELAVRQMSGIEDELGLGDVAKFTAAAPPKGA